MFDTWKEEFSSRELEEFEQLNETSYIQRRNIEQLEDGTYRCECRIISIEEYEKYLNDLSSPSHMELIGRLNRLESAQEENQSNVLVLMMALAEIYETMIS